MSELEQSGGKPNLTPILDMVFQLITFFMLVINFKVASIDTALKLPVLGDAAPAKKDPGGAPLVFNIRYPEKPRTEHGKRIDPDAGFKPDIPLLNIYGLPKIPLDNPDLVRRKLAGSAAQARQIKKKGENEELDTLVIIRADQKIPFHYLYNAISGAQKVGYRRFGLKGLKGAAKSP